MVDKKVILVDMDNVLADQIGGFYSILKSEHPSIECPKIDLLNDFDIEKSFAEKYREDIKSIRLRKGFFESLKPIEGAVDALQSLVNKGFEVRLVTAPTWDWKYCIPEKYAWIDKHLGQEWRKRMIVTRDKTFIRGDLLIDDKPNVTGSLQPSWEHILYDQPYNRCEKSKKRIKWTAFEDGSSLDLLVFLK